MPGRRSWRPAAAPSSIRRFAPASSYDAISVWLKADLEILVQRTRGRTSRPLLNAGDPRTILAELMAVRYPVYAEADIVIETGAENIEVTVERIVAALRDRASSDHSLEV